MISEKFQQAADTLLLLVHTLAARIEVATRRDPPPPDTGTGTGATDDELLSLLSPIASKLQELIDSLEEGGSSEDPDAPVSPAKPAEDEPIVRPE